MDTGMRIGIVTILVVVAGGILVLKARDAADPSSGRSSVNTAAAPETPTPPGTSAPAAVPKLIDLGATKCIPCKMMAPILEELKREYAGRLVVEFIDVWENPNAGQRYQIRTIPTQIFYDASGKELFRHEGFYSKEDILGKWKELGVDLEKKPVPS